MAGNGVPTLEGPSIVRVIHFRLPVLAVMLAPAGTSSQHACCVSRCLHEGFHGMQVHSIMQSGNYMYIVNK